MKIETGEAMAVLGAIGLFFVLLLGDWDKIRNASGWILGLYVLVLAIWCIKVELKEKP